MFERVLKSAVLVLSVLLCLFTISEVNFQQLQPQSALAIFVMLGLALCFLTFPAHPKLKENRAFQVVDVVLALAVIVCCGYVVVQTEPAFQDYWLGGANDATPRAIGDRAGDENAIDFYIGLVGLVLVLEATRRAIGLIVPLLALAFVAHSYYCFGSVTYGWPQLPMWVLPHGGQSLKSISTTAFIQTLGVFGPAADVMFKYVFLFVVFGAFLEMSGATQYVIDFAERVFGRSPGGPAKVSVLGSGLMGSLSGSAVANAVTTGSFTIPMMRNSGFQPHIAGGITAAAASGGALVPPVMGAGAYMMLELVKPQVTFLQVAKAAIIPATLYYLSIWMIVHFYSKRLGVQASPDIQTEHKPLWQFEGIVFFGALAVLVGLLIVGKTPFKAVSGALVLILVLSALRKKLALGMTPRVLAIVSFFGIVAIHQFVSLNFSDNVPTWMRAYLAPGWQSPNSGEVELSFLFDSFLSSSIVGMLALLLFGLAHPAWRPGMIKAMVGAAKNGVSLVAASACVGIIIGIVQQTGIASDFSTHIKTIVHSNLFIALVGIMACSIVLGMGVPSVVCYLLMATLMSSLLSDMGVIPLAAHLFIFYFGMMSMVTPPVALAAYASASIAEARIMPTALAAFKFSLVGFTLPFMFIYRPELLLMSALPEVSGLKTDAVSANAPAKVAGLLMRYGKAVKNSEVKFDLQGNSATQETATTDSAGQFTTTLQPGRWTLARKGPQGKWETLGTIDLDPARPRAQRDESGKTVDERILFEDERLSLLSVAIAVSIAIVGIVALAAGIAGFLFTQIRVPVRIGMLIAAGLLLSPDLEISGHDFGLYTNIAGCAIFAVTGVLNYLRSKSLQATSGQTPRPSVPNS